MFLPGMRTGEIKKTRGDIAVLEEKRQERREALRKTSAYID